MTRDVTVPGDAMNAAVNDLPRGRASPPATVEERGERATGRCMRRIDG